MEREMKRVFYVGFYDRFRDGKQIRIYSFAAAKKMDFVCKALRKLDNQVEIVSPAVIKPGHLSFAGNLREEIGENIFLSLPSSWGAKNKLLRVARVLWSRAWLFGYLMKHAKKGQPVLVYHHYDYALPVLLARFFKRFHLVLEIEEQYSMVWKLTPFQRWEEKLLLRHGADDCMVVSEMLAEKLGVRDPLVSYGSYAAYRGEIPPKHDDGQETLLVYTGSVDKVKGSAFIAVETMLHLPERYRLVISGPVAKKDEQEFRALVERVNAQCGRIAVEYRGVLDDAEYQALLLSADIALNPQQGGGYDEFLFPSKILTYMSYGLPVVSTAGKSIVKSKIADLITFADEFSAESVAAAVQEAEILPAQVYLNRLNDLEKDFLKGLDRRMSRI